MLQSTNEKCSVLKSKNPSSLSIALMISRKTSQALLWSLLEVKAEISGFNQSDFRVTMNNIICVCILFAFLFRFLLDNENHHKKRTESCTSMIMQFLAFQCLHLLTYSEYLEEAAKKKKLPVFSYQNLNLSKISSAGQRSCLSTTKLPTPLIINEQIYFINTVLYNLWKGYKAQKRTAVKYDNGDFLSFWSWLINPGKETCLPFAQLKALLCFGVWFHYKHYTEND